MQSLCILNIDAVKQCNTKPDKLVIGLVLICKYCRTFAQNKPIWNIQQSESSSEAVNGIIILAQSVIYNLLSMFNANICHHTFGTIVA